MINKVLQIDIVRASSAFSPITYEMFTFLIIVVAMSSTLVPVVGKTQLRVIQYNLRRSTACIQYRSHCNKGQL